MTDKGSFSRRYGYAPEGELVREDAPPGFRQLPRTEIRLERREASFPTCSPVKLRLQLGGPSECHGRAGQRNYRQGGSRKGPIARRRLFSSRDK